MGLRSLASTRTLRPCRAPAVAVDFPPPGGPPDLRDREGPRSHVEAAEQAS